jgi:putative acyl-CoA dehydrogenase
MAMLFRQSPLNAIWEGSGNVIALDVLRAHKSFTVLMRDIKVAEGMSPEFDAFVATLEADIVSGGYAENALSETAQRGARNLTDRLAVAMQASILVRYGDPVVSDITSGYFNVADNFILGCMQTAKAYISSRLGRNSSNSGWNFGAHVLDKDTIKYLIDRNMANL